MPPEKIKRIYISGPMSGLPELNFPAFHAAALTLRDRGWDVVNPAELNPCLDITWAAAMKVDIAALVTCDAIFLLPGWKKSKGASLEHRIAVDLSMPTLGDLSSNPRTVQGVTDWDAA